jgi:multidrug efflux pump subunit AcrB
LTDPLIRRVPPTPPMWWIQVDQDRVRQLGVSSKSLAEALNAVTTGMVVTEVRDSIYLIGDIRLDVYGNSNIPI